MPDDASDFRPRRDRPVAADANRAGVLQLAGGRAVERASARAKLAAAACDVVRRHGLAGLDVDALSGAAHLRRPTIRRAFAQLDELLDDVTACAQRELVALIVDAVQGEIGRNGIDTLVQAHRLYAHAQPHMYEAAVRRSGRSSHVAREAEDLLLRTEAAAVQACGASAADAADVAWCVRAVVFGAVRLEATDRVTRQTDIDRRFQHLARVLTEAALAPPPAAASQDPTELRS
jgi:hypothetical protein